MSIPLETALFATAVRTFEDLAFMFPEPSGDRVEEREPNAGVSVAFQGPISGRLELRVCAHLLPALAANMLGDDEQVSPAQQLDALGEIANVVCGNVLPVITNAKEIFHLEGPRSLTGADLLNADANADAFVRLYLDEGCAGLHLIVSEGSLN